MSLAEIMHALPLACEQWEDEIKKAVAEVEKAKQVWESTQNNAVAQEKFEELRELFCPLTIDGVTYEKRWSIPAFLNWINTESDEMKQEENFNQILSDLSKEIAAHTEDGKFKLNEDDIAVLKYFISDKKLDKSVRDLCGNILGNE